MVTFYYVSGIFASSTALICTVLSADRWLPNFAVCCLDISWSSFKVDWLFVFNSGTQQVSLLGLNGVSSVVAITAAESTVSETPSY